MTSIYYYDEQDLSGFRFLVLIRAFVIQTSLGLQNLNMKGKKKRILVEVVKCANINGLLAFGWREVITGNTPAFAGYISASNNQRTKACQELMQKTWKRWCKQEN